MDIPEGIEYGRVTAFVTSFRADGPDPGDAPDSVPLDGLVTITPRVGTLSWPALPRPQKSVMTTLECPVIDGVLYAPGVTRETASGSDPGVMVIATHQPDALPDRVQYEVKWQLVGARIQPAGVVIDVPAGGTVDLATVAGTVIVTYAADRERAEAAAESAVGAAEVAAAAAVGLASHVVEASWSGSVVLPGGVGLVRAHLTGDTVLSAPGRGPLAESVNLVVSQDSTGGHTLTIPGVRWGESLAYSATLEGGGTDLVTLLWDGSTWWGAVGITNGGLG